MSAPLTGLLPKKGKFRIASRTFYICLFTRSYVNADCLICPQLTVEKKVRLAFGDCFHQCGNNWVAHDPQLITAIAYLIWVHSDMEYSFYGEKDPPMLFKRKRPLRNLFVLLAFLFPTVLRLFYFNFRSAVLVLLSMIKTVILFSNSFSFFKGDPLMTTGTGENWGTANDRRPCRNLCYCFFSARRPSSFRGSSTFLEF